MTRSDLSRRGFLQFVVAGGGSLVVGCSFGEGALDGAGGSAFYADYHQWQQAQDAKPAAAAKVEQGLSIEDSGAKLLDTFPYLGVPFDGFGNPS